MDDPALEAGSRIKGGEFSRANLKIIFKWKTNGRGIRRLCANTDEQIVDALQLATRAKTERSAIAVLVGLYGVAVPVASAILTAIDPERYTIIDFRALEALGVRVPTPSIDFYLEYIACCRDLASRYGVSLRDLDRALWQWSKERGRSG
ncbi:MAG: hypothetical protein EXQ96_05815 [Alphaproteobacteria bacterium]|nr:hypothetical protein [Alphaproteobacteria bacterium]